MDTFWIGLFIFLAVCVYCAHEQFLQGYDNPFFDHKTAEEKRLREAVIAKREKEAGVVK